MTPDDWIVAASAAGLNSLEWFWSPVLVWTVVAGLALLGLSALRHMHPLTNYRLRQALLLSLPAVLLLAPWAPRLTPTPAAIATKVGTVIPSRAPPIPAEASVADPFGVVLAVALLAVGIATLLGLVRIVRELRGLRRIAVLADRIDDPRALSLLHELMASLGIERPVVLLEGTRYPIPMTFHWTTSWISIPKELCTSPERLRIALAHELTHIRRADAVWSLAERIVSLPFAFHPLVRSLTRSVRHYREVSCDAEVMGTGAVHPRQYAELLLEMSQRPSPVPSLAPGMFSRKSNLKERLEIMNRLIGTSPSRGLRIRSVAIASSFFASIVLAAACGVGSDSDGPGSDASASSDLVTQLTSRFGTIEGETREAVLARLDIQMEYLRERIEGLLDDIQAAEASGDRMGQHVYEQYQLLNTMYLERLETYETLKLERETEARLAERSE